MGWVGAVMGGARERRGRGSDQGPGDRIGHWRAVSTCGPPNRSASMTSMTTTCCDRSHRYGRQARRPPASAGGPVRRWAMGLGLRPAALIGKRL